MGRRPLVAGNWKMNPIPEGALNGHSPYLPRTDVDVVIFPTFLDLRTCLDAGLACGAQYGNPLDCGACTGDVSMTMIKTIGCTAVLCGHSERRTHHNETDQMVAEQVTAALQKGLMPILCIGENADQRELDQTKEVIERQLKAVTLDPRIVIAYEPVWAIGTGKTPTPQDAQDIHPFIRSLLPKPNEMRIVYGGSMNAKNAKELLVQADIDGGLIGGASLKPAEFKMIVEAACTTKV